MLVDNEFVLALVEEWGLRTVVEELAVACDRMAIVCDATSGSRTAWESDALTLRRVLPLIINEQ